MEVRLARQPDVVARGSGEQCARDLALGLAEVADTTADALADP